MIYFRKYFSLLLFILSLVFAQNKESTKDTVIIDGIKYAKVNSEQYFEDQDYDEGMWRLAPGYGFGLIRGETFSLIPHGYSINVISPYGFNIGPLYYNISFAFGRFEGAYNDVTIDNAGIITSDSLLAIDPSYIGIGGDINFFESIYTEGHVGRVGFGFGFRGFLGYDIGNLGEILGNGLDLNMKIGSEFYISSEIIEKANPSYWATISLRLIYSFHSLFDS